MNTLQDELLDQLENVPYTSREQDLCFAAADEIRQLRRWKNWGLHVAVCPNWRKQTCWDCVSPPIQDEMEQYGVAQAIKDETAGHVR